MKYLLVALGAGIGGGFRYWLSAMAHKFFPVYFPVGTLAVNVIGSFILGFLLFGFDEKENLHTHYKLLIGTGFCGGLTTFSTFSFETFTLMKETAHSLALLNIGANLFATLIGIYLAYIVTR